MARRDLNRNAIEQAGRRRLAALVLHWLLRPLGYLELTDIFSLDLVDLPPIPEITGYRIERAGAAEIADIAANIKRDQPVAVIENLWQQGHHCFVAKYAGRVVAYDWIAFSAVQEEEYAYRPEPNHAICIDAFTIEEHRGKGLHYALLLTMLHWAAASGKSTCYTAASIYNIASWKTHLRLGWRREFTIGWFRPMLSLKRMPWRLTKDRYPVQLDWTNHSWFTEPPAPHLSNP